MGSQSEIAVMPLSLEDIDAVPVEQKALYFSLCFLVSELNTLQRISLWTYQTNFEEKAFDAIHMIQSNTMHRVVSSKCFEAVKFVSSCMEKSKDTSVKDICSFYAQKFADINAEKGRNVAKHVRDKITFHLDFGQAVSSTRQARSADCNLYIHALEGNCYFPAGESVIFESNLLSANTEAKHSITSNEDHLSWVNWTVTIVSLLKEMHTDVFEKFVYPAVRGKLHSQRKVRIPEQLMFVQGKSFPTFFYGTTP